MPIRVSRPFTGNSPVYTTITRDSLHRITQIQDPDGGITTRNYAGLMVAETDRRGQITVTQFNPSQQVEAKALTAPGGGSNTTQYVYDVNNQLTQVIRANGATTTMTYDMLGRKTRMSDPNTGTFTYQYDNEGHVTATTGPDGKTIRYAYNRNCDLLSKTYPDETRNTVTYGAVGQPNAVGRVISVKDAAGKVQFAYDARGRVIQHKRYVALKKKTYVTGYAFDSDDRLVALTYPDGFAVKYGYDALGNVNSVVDSSGRVVANNFTYTPSGRLTGLQYGNGAASSYGYDVLDRMVSLQSTSPNGTAFQNLAYTYDADSNLTQIQDASGRNQHFAYDSMNRLISAQGDGIDGYGQETYSYDSVGNLLTKGADAFGMDPIHTDRAVCMTVNAPGSTSCAQTPLDSIAINYDAKGNVIQMGNMQYSYDAENRMIAEGSNGSVVERNVYDFWGDRVVQQTAGDTRVFIDDVYEEGASGIAHHVKTQNLLLATIVTPLGSGSKSTTVAKITVPVYSISPAPPLGVSHGQFLAASMGFSVLVMFFCSCLRVTRQGRHLRVRLGAPVLFRSESIRAFKSVLLVVLIFSFVAGGANSGYALGSENGSAGGHSPQMVTTTTTTTKTTVAPSPKRFYYHMNHLGGVHVITDDSANVVEVREYKPYGEMYVHNSSAATPAQNLPFGFDGQRMDGASSLYYFKARFYSPQIGRFLSADSEINHPTTPQALNRYAFAGGNPIRYIDPSGHSWFDFLIGAVVFIAIVVVAAFSGGAILAGIALAGGLIGFAVGAGIASGMGYNKSSEDFWQIAMTGAILGAAIGAGGAQIISEGMEAAAADAEAGEAVEAGEAAAEAPAKTLSQRVSADMVKSAMFGGPQSLMVHELNGSGTDNLLRSVAEGTGIAAVSGAVIGAGTRWASGKLLGPTLAGAALRSFGIGMGLTIVSQGALWTFAGLEKQSIGGWALNGSESAYNWFSSAVSGWAEAAYEYGSSGTSLLPINEITR
jgi:RHS repeat-associated protein